MGVVGVGPRWFVLLLLRHGMYAVLNTIRLFSDSKILYVYYRYYSYCFIIRLYSKFQGILTLNNIYS